MLLKHNSTYVSDQIATLQFEAAEWVVEHNPIDALRTMIKVASTMKRIPTEILGSILIVNIKLFKARGDQEAVDLLLASSLSHLSPSQLSKL